MRRFVEGADRGQTTLFPECLGDWIGEVNPVRVVGLSRRSACATQTRNRAPGDNAPMDRTS
jgi:hypothetical protein